MKRVFLSYAAEDQAVADRIARWLRTRGLEPYWFQDEHVRGGRFVGEIERAIGEADLFVVLLSPHFLTSAWCRHERDLAFRREIGLPRQFICVLKVSGEVTGDVGFLGNYDHLDAALPLTDGKLRRIERALDLHDEPKIPVEAPIAPPILFFNRENELDAILKALTHVGDKDAWLVVAPPKMGKSWFLNRVRRGLLARDRDWSVRLVDLRGQPRELCADPWLLLGRLLDIPLAVGEQSRETRLRQIVALVCGRNTRQLYMLDSADLLETAVADELKETLAEIHHRVRVSGNRVARMGLVISSRRIGPWGTLGRTTYRMRFILKPLSQVSLDVVHEALTELNWDCDADLLWSWAEKLHRFSEGLPPLLARGLGWVVESGACYPEECLGAEIFDEIARPYIRDDLLAPDSLLPWGRSSDDQAKRILEKFLKTLVVYRLLTRSHLQFHINEDPDLQAALSDVDWDISQLWKALAETSLYGLPSGELWLAIELPVRRILFRYYNTKPELNISAHAAAQQFYFEWLKVQGGGRERPVILVECLWHAASRLVMEHPVDAGRLLVEKAAEIAYVLADSPLFAPDELLELVVERLDGDDELVFLLRPYPGLLAAVIDSVVQVIGGGFRLVDTYVERSEASVLYDLADKVREDRTSRALLIYGRGGVGKTKLVQQMARRHGMPMHEVFWLWPIDVDDSEYWLQSSLENSVARSIDPERKYFTPYFDYLTRLSLFEAGQTSHESVVAQLARVNRIFIECYRSFVESTGCTVVITLDTVEAIRSMYPALTLTQWMKALPSTLFILAGRPLAESGYMDPIREELGESQHPLEFEELMLEGFSGFEAKEFLRRCELDGSPDPEQEGRLIELTERQPLWLALAAEYLLVADLPPEMAAPLEEQHRPHTQFRRRLTSLYLGADFWSEVVRRLVIIRRSVNRDVWQRLMADLSLPADVPDWDTAWTMLLGQPWIRLRANRGYVTLHDALAEELAQRMIPLHDQNGVWQRTMWRRAKDIYTELAAQTADLPAERTRLIAALGAEADIAVLQAAAGLDGRKRKLDQLQTARLHYAILDDFDLGTALFVELYDRASNYLDPLFLELICREIERFLPRGENGHSLDNFMRLVVRDFHRWLEGAGARRHIEIAVRLAGFLVRTEQAGSALAVLDGLSDESLATPELRYRLANERGNACMRIPGQIGTAREHFQAALSHARHFADPDSVLREAEAHKEFGFYYRNLGRWLEADRAYQTALDILSKVVGPGSLNAYREEMASIQTNWAYLKALQGDYPEARSLIDSATQVRRRIAQWHGVAISLSVSGEIYRYDNRYQLAWRHYKEAESIFHVHKSRPWLGQLYQQMAICLYHASREGIRVVDEDDMKQAKGLARQSLEICRESAVRSYPAALNRAGRIRAESDLTLGLENLSEAIDEARKIGDGWFLSASLIEYIELNYRAWIDTGRHEYRDAIAARTTDVGEAIATYEFSDVAARWDLLQGHLLVHDALRTPNYEDLDRALGHYSAGFRALASRRIASHGSVAITREFRKFHDLFRKLPQSVRWSWHDRLLTDFMGEKGKRSISLLSLLEELY